MKKLAFIISILTAVSAFSFPMRGLEAGAAIDLGKFSLKDGTALKENSPVKMMLVWRSDKRLSKKQYEVFKEFCSEEKMKCIAVDRQGELHEDAGVISALDKDGYTDTWGIITLPLTLILDSKNKIIDAVGYEGQYKHKMREYMQQFK